MCHNCDHPRIYCHGICNKKKTTACQISHNLNISPCLIWSGSPSLQPSLHISECANPTPTTRGVTTLASTAHASQTTRPTCSAVTITTRPSSTAATRQSSRQSCRSTWPPPQMAMLTSKSKLFSQWSYEWTSLPWMLKQNTVPINWNGTTCMLFSKRLFK